MTIARGPLAGYLAADHARIDALLSCAVVDPDRFDVGAFEEFRAGLLRHIGVEEKILLADARRRRGGEPLPIARTLRVEHGALASLLVPTPDAALVAEIRELLRVHNSREEGAGGVYEICEALAGPEAHALLERARAAPSVPLAPHFRRRGGAPARGGSLAGGRAGRRASGHAADAVIDEPRAVGGSPSRQRALLARTEPRRPPQTARHTRCRGTHDDPHAHGRPPPPQPRPPC